MLRCLPMFCAIVAGVCCAADLKLIPVPQSVKLLEGAFTWTDHTSIGLAAPEREDDQFAAGQLVRELSRALGLTPPVTVEGPVLIGLLTDPAVTRRLVGEDLSALEGRGPQAYALLVTPEGIVAAGSGTAGTFYAIQTLKQLIRANRQGNAIPAVRILDWPGLRYRGYSDDISRGPIPTMDFFKRQIRTMAEFKMNMLTFYTEHVFKLAKHPIIAPPDGITAQEVKELSEYARRYHVELVGNFQSFGHAWNILRHEQYAHLRETPSIFTPAREETYEFLDDVYSEIAPAYDSPLFNVNCDETYGLGEGPSKELADRIGVGGVYVQHMNRIHDILRDKYGKRMMMWGDIALQHPEIVQQLAKDTILLSWGYGAADNYDAAIEPFVRAGFEFMVCPGVSCWSAIFPNYRNATVNIRNYVRDGARFGALGMLNTTWDDDGENLFHWNFYGTNWGAACAWRPTDSSLDDYNAAYAQVSYGTPDDKITRAIQILSDLVSNPLTQGNMNPAFWVRPFGALATSFDMVVQQSTDLCMKTEEAITLLKEAKPEAQLDAEDLDYLIFAARRLHTIGRGRYLMTWAARKYTEAMAAFPDVTPATQALDFAVSSADELAATVRDLRSEYERLWLLENRPWWLQEMRAKYDSLLGDLTAYADRLRAAKQELVETGVPPDPAGLGLGLLETSRRALTPVPSGEALLPADAPWWDAAWPYCLPLKVEMGEGARTDYPLEVRLSFGDRQPDPTSVRVVEYLADGTLRPLPTQYDPAGENAGSVTFVLTGTTPSRGTRLFGIYFDVAGSPPKPAQDLPMLTVTREGDSYWVENDRYRVLVGPHGAHVFEWYVKALDNLEITHPGRHGWAGFADSGGVDRDAPFDIVVEASGPLMARLRATSSAAGSEKLFTFYAGEPYVEVMLARPVSFQWDYDNVDNFAADRGNPGRALFSNGHSEPVCRAEETIHAVARDVYWGAKVRDDGFVLANITPDVKATHMTGPGGGWGGVGIEASVPAAHFVTFADKVTGDPTETLNAVQQRLDTRNPPRAWIGRLIERPQR